MNRPSMLRLSLLLAVFCFFAWTDPAPAGGLEWNEYNQGMALAKKMNKKAMINFYADWCGYCRLMEEKTFNDGQVAEFITQHFVLIKVDTERARNLAQEYYVRSLPMVWIVGPQGEKLGAARGFIPPEKFLEILQETKNW